MMKVIDESGQVHWVLEGALQGPPVSEPSPGTDFDRTISRLAAMRGKKPSKYEKPQYRPKKKPAYKPKKKPAKKPAKKKK